MISDTQTATDSTSDMYLHVHVCVHMYDVNQAVLVLALLLHTECFQAVYIDFSSHTLKQSDKYPQKCYNTNSLY